MAMIAAAKYSFLFMSESKIISDRRYWISENGESITFNNSVLRLKEHRIGILAAREVIDADRPGAVRKFFYSVIAFDVHRKVNAEIVRDPVLVSFRVK